MKIFGSLTELLSLVLRKSGFTVTIAAPTTVGKDYEFKLPNTDGNTSAVVVTDTHVQTLTNKTLDNPAITNLAGANLFTDAQIAEAANIARTKLASGTANHVLINNGSGVMSSEVTLAKSRGGFGVDMTGLTPSVNGSKVYRVDGSIATSQAGIRLYKTVSEAITAAVTAGASNTDMHIINVGPGVYTENITMYDGIIIKGTNQLSTRIQGTISSDAGLSGANTKAGLVDIEFLAIPTTTTPCFNLIGAISTHLVSFLCFPAADVNITALHAAPAIGQTVIHGLCSVYVQPTVPFTSNIYAWENNGAGLVSVYTSSSYVVSNQSAGEVCVLDEEGTGIRNYNGVLVYADMTNAAFSGTVNGFCTESTSTGERLSQGGQVRLTGAGSGTAVAFSLNTGTDASEYFFTGSSVIIDGFANEYVSFTSVNAVQKIWLNSVNKDLPKSGTGRSIITPYDEKKSGFVEWGAVTGSNYWSISGTDFTVVPAGVGVVRGAPVDYDANQTIGLTQGVNFIYMDSTGVIAKSSSGGEDLYSGNIVLFQVLYDGTETRVFKENHPYKFESAVSGAWHRLFGSLLEGTGAIISQLGAASARTIQMSGADVLTDHGLDTVIPDSTGVAVPLTLAYRGVGGLVKLQPGGTVTAIPGQFNSGTTLANTTNHVVWRIVAAKDNLEGTAQFFAIADTTTYANLAAANAAIANGSIASIPSELNSCEVVMLGYVVIDGDNAGGGDLVGVTPARKTFGASFLGGSPSNTANLMSITDLPGPIIDTATTVQSALAEVNTNAARKAASSTDNALARFDGLTGQLLQNGTITQDDSGNLASVGTVNSHAIPVGTDAFVTADAVQTLTQKTLTTPTISNFTNAGHDHSDASKGGLIIAASTTQQGAVTTAAQTLGGEKTFNDGLKSDTIAEKTAAAGVTIDGGKVKDGQFEANSTDANLLPVGTTAQRSSAAAGRTRFNSTFGCLEVHDGTRWVQVPKAHEVSLINGTVDLYTPETGVVAYEAVLYSSVGTATSITKVLVVNDNSSWTYAATEAGDTVATIVVNASTGKLSLTATGAGTCKARVLVLV